MIWSKQEVRERIKILEKLGTPLNDTFIKKNHGGLYNASRKLFGSWGNAITSSGFDYDLIKKVTKWTPELIIERIKELKKNNESLANSEIRIKYATLRAAAMAKFGSWKKAVEAAGLDYDQINLRSHEEKWDKEKIIIRITLIYKEGGDISDSHLKKFNNSLLKAGINHFGNWRNAVEASGIDYNLVLKCVPYKWNKNNVIDEIKRLAAIGEELTDTNISKNHAKLYGGIMVNFSNLKSAVNCAGFDYNLISHFKQNYWSKEKIIEQIIQLHKELVQLNDSDIARTNGDLRSIAIKYFGSWRNAINSSGLNYSQICKDLNEEARKGFLFEKYCIEIFKILNPSIKRQTKPVISDCIPDFIDEDIGQWIEIKFNCWGKGVNETIQKYLQYIDKLTIIYLIGEKPKDRPGVYFMQIDTFYWALKLADRPDLIEDLNQLKKGIIPTKIQLKLRNF